jgi:lipopolysaccharide biosynthesis protein
LIKHGLTFVQRYAAVQQIITGVLTIKWRANTNTEGANDTSFCHSMENLTSLAAGCLSITPADRRKSLNKATQSTQAAGPGSYLTDVYDRNHQRPGA